MRQCRTETLQLAEIDLSDRFRGNDQPINAHLCARSTFVPPPSASLLPPFCLRNKFTPSLPPATEAERIIYRVSLVFR